MIKRDLLMVLVICALAWVLSGCLSWLAISCPAYRYACAILVSLAVWLIATHYLLKRLVGRVA